MESGTTSGRPKVILKITHYGRYRKRKTERAAPGKPYFYDMGAYRLRCSHSLHDLLDGLYGIFYGIAFGENHRQRPIATIGSSGLQLIAPSESIVKVLVESV